jgi:hypothetical protein
LAANKFFRKQIAGDISIVLGFKSRPVHFKYTRNNQYFSDIHHIIVYSSAPALVHARVFKKEDGKCLYEGWLNQMKWVTREFVHVDRTAIPWLVKNFVDKNAEFIFVPMEKIGEVVDKEGAIPYDAPGAELGHHGEKCSFDAIVDKYKILDQAVLELAKIVRAADTGKLEAAPEAAGLDAIMTGISIAARDDNEAIRNAAPVYDALYNNCRLKRIKEHYKTELGKMDRGQRRIFLKKKLDG